jgi:hypothetical protein
MLSEGVSICVLFNFLINWSIFTKIGKDTEGQPTSLTTIDYIADARTCDMGVILVQLSI